MFAPLPKSTPGNKPGRQGNYEAPPHVGIGYDAIKRRGRRASPPANTFSEDLQLRDLARRQLLSNLRDLDRNFSLAGWMVRRHLDYVATFNFRSKTGIKDLDDDINRFHRWWSLPNNCDPASRHSLQGLTRLWEARRVLDGDILTNRLADGRVQTIEGDRIMTFGGPAIPFDELGIKDPENVINGVYVNQNGRPKAYMVFKRHPLWTGLRWDKAVPAKFADLLGTFGRYDQVRGIAQLASAANSMRDVYESLDYAAVKGKIAQFFALAVTRAASDRYEGEEEREGESNPDADPDKPRYDLDISGPGAIVDMDPGDKMEVIESNTPSTEFQAFTKLEIALALKALDIPYSFFDESNANYSSSRMAGMQYLEACKAPQHEIRLLLDKITRWRLGLAVVDGDITLPGKMTVRDLQFEYTHAGAPLYDPMREIGASVIAINAGLSSEIREAKKLGVDVFELIDERAAVKEYANKKGVILSTALPSNALLDPNNETAQKQHANEQQSQNN